MKPPYYMIPSTLDIIDELPMTSNQKIDRKRLPEARTLLSFSSGEEIKAASTETEEETVKVIAEHINRDDISMDDHFFNDWGHSLLAAVITSQLRKNPLFEDMSVVDMYKHPILSDLAAEIERRHSLGNTETVHKQRDVYTPTGLSYYTCCFFRGAAMLLIAFLFGLEWLGPFFVYSYYYWATGGPVFSLNMMLMMYFALLPGLAVFTILFKWLVIDKMEPGGY